tara:strand:- start:3289 stop:4656 length:1368 start_codon:yes stop_codon:yes gene_type:complete
MRKRKKIDSSTIVLSSIIVIFTIIVFLSLPVLFNYKSLQSEIETKFNKDFKINLKILDDIAFRVFPRPHLLIKKANLDLNVEDEKSVVLETEDLKLYIPSNKIYSKKDIIITDLEFGDLNLNLKLNDINDIRNHLYYKINKPINISNLKLFLLDNKNDVILISPLKKLSYQINEKNKSKELKLKGSIFDIEFNSIWKRSYKKPKSTSNEITLTNPDIYIKNIFLFKNKNNFNGSSSIDFLNENVSFNYKYKNQKISINSPNEKNNQQIRFNSNIELNPFYFDGEIIFDQKKLSFISDTIIYYILNTDKELLENLNGRLDINFQKLDNILLDNGKITFSINEGKIKVLNSYLEIEGLGIINTSFNYFIKEDELFLKTTNILNINNKKQFAKKFQLNQKKIENINQIYFDFERNIDNGEMHISNIFVNSKNNQNLLEEVLEVKNIQVLKSIMRELLN